MEKIKIIPYDDSFFESYVKFANRNWGNSCYQGRREYIKWLYDENPTKNKKETDFILAVSENEKVVGCIHKMRLTWNVGKGLYDTPSMHNLMVDKNYRHGIGLKLTWNALSLEEHALTLGTKAPMAYVMYEKIFKSQEVGMGWYRRILTPTRMLSKYFFNKLFYLNKNNFIIKYDTINKIKLNYCYQFNISLNPDNSIIDRIITNFEGNKLGEEYPNWDRENFKWRFFHPLGPKHLLIYHASDIIDNFIIFSIGPRKGVNIARIIEIKAINSEMLKNMLDLVIRIIKELHGNVLDIISSDNNIKQMIQLIGWKIMKSPPKTYIYHKNKEDSFLYPVFNGSAGDCGFEAFLTKIQG